MGNSASVPISDQSPGSELTVPGTESSDTQTVPGRVISTSDAITQTKPETSSMETEADVEMRSVETQTKRIKCRTMGTQTVPQGTRMKSKCTQTTLTATKTSLMIVPFYEPPPKPEGKDFANRTLSEILNYDDTTLEQSHNYIQVLFPLPEPSIHNHEAPLIDRDVFNAFRSRPELRDRLRQSFIRMLKFYGFRLRTHKNKGPGIWRLQAFRRISKPWLRTRDHNHKRISRILRSLRILGLDDESAAFFRALDKVHHKFKGKISDESFECWQRAAEGPLSTWGDCPYPGPDFLVELDMQQAEEHAAEASGEVAQAGDGNGGVEASQVGDADEDEA